MHRAAPAPQHERDQQKHGVAAHLHQHAEQRPAIVALGRGHALGQAERDPHQGQHDVAPQRGHREAGQLEGLKLEEAIRKAALFLIIIQGSSVVWAPIWGFVLDRWDRLTAVCVALLVAAIAYFWVGFSPSPIVAAFIPAAILLGIGEFSAIMSGAALIGQSAPEDIRGSVLGLFNLCGSFGILCITVTSGIVFDAWMPGAPFVVVGGLNLFVFLVAFFVRRRIGFVSPRTASADIHH